MVVLSTTFENFSSEPLGKQTLLPIALQCLHERLMLRQICTHMQQLPSCCVAAVKAVQYQHTCNWEAMPIAHNFAQLLAKLCTIVHNWLHNCVKANHDFDTILLVRSSFTRAFSIRFCSLL